MLQVYSRCDVLSQHAAADGGYLRGNKSSDTWAPQEITHALSRTIVHMRPVKSKPALFLHSELLHSRAENPPHVLAVISSFLV
jgi:hypothetical protein